jgi:hypothetical protein
VYNSNNTFFSDIELSAFAKLTTKSQLWRPWLGLGCGTYLPHFTKDNHLFFMKGSFDVVFREKTKFTFGVFTDYMPAESNFNTGLQVNYPIKMLELENYSFGLDLKSEVSYNSYLENWMFGLSLGVSTNKIVRSHYRKPVLYIYPKDTMDLQVSLNFNGNLTFTWPQYNGVWDLTVYPNSDILNKEDGKTYSYLFWEGNYAVPSVDTIREGFIVNKQNLPQFFQEKLSHIGLNDREINDFITYWVPCLQNEQYFIHFLMNEACEFVATYDFSKEPDNLIRLIALFMEPPADAFDIKEQKLEKNQRNAYLIVEWGGVEINN